MADEPMSDERLAVIHGVLSVAKMDATTHGLVWELLAEVERQRAVIEQQQAEIAAMRPVVEAVATHGMYTPFYPPDGPALYGCDWCHARARKLDAIKHTDGCEMTQARAYVAQHPATRVTEVSGGN